MTHSKPPGQPSYPSRKNQPSLRHGSRILTILSAIANESVRIATIFVVETAPYSTGRRSAKWRYEMLAENPNIDFERILRDAQIRHRYARAVAEIRRRRFARLVRRNNTLVLEITEEGKRRLVPHQIHAMALSRPKRWDGRWNIVAFDIPESQRLQRDTLRTKLRDLDFLQLQKSLFVSPYPRADVLDMLAQSLNVHPFVTFFTADSLGYHEAKALAHFHLRRPRLK